MCAIPLICPSYFRFSWPAQASTVLEYIIPDPLSRAAYFEPGEDMTAEDEPYKENNRRWNEAGLDEVMHIGEIASQKWDKFLRGYDPTKEVANTIFFHPFILQIPKDGMITAELCVLTGMPLIAI